MMKCNVVISTYLRSMLPKDDRASKRIIAATTTVGSCIKVDYIVKTKRSRNLGFFVGFAPKAFFWTFFRSKNQVELTKP